MDAKRLKRKALFITFLMALGATLITHFLITKRVLKDQYKGVQEPTFTEHVGPLVFKNCTPCHREGGGAPFNLTSYKEVYRKKKTIVEVTQSGFMPPWPADNHYTRFVGEMFLTEEEKIVIKKWVETGAPEGPGGILKTPRFRADNSLIGIPDTTLSWPVIAIKGDGTDRFLVVKLPFILPKDTFVRAIEFVPGRKELVHHVNGHLLTYDWNSKKELHKGKDYIDVEDADYSLQFPQLNLLNDDGSKPERFHSATNYLPGVFGTIYPEGIGGFALKRKNILVANDLHFGPSGKDVVDSSKVHIFYGKKESNRPTYETMLGTNGLTPIVPPLVILPNKVMSFRTEAIIPEDISILTINPHMHLLGMRFLAYGIKPSGDTIRLIRINRWDFRWQYFYTFLNPVKVPAGTKIVVEAVFDNTSENPLNPNKPPKVVSERKGSMRTTDEMFQFIITWMPYQKGDEKINLETKKRSF